MIRTERERVRESVLPKFNRKQIRENKKVYVAGYSHMYVLI
jgi:hypothetical protein